MSPQILFVAVMALSLVNGLISPLLPIVYVMLPAWAPHVFYGIGDIKILPEILFYMSSLIVATGTFLVGGVPAALYENLMGGEREGRAAMLIWLVGVLALTLPTASQF
ncbi:MAG: hypothetical protein FJX42_01895 [Alphaproteobacteria bacterium]|nr:hypothetical protein [Alphaproteobacteria bacterium]